MRQHGENRIVHPTYPFSYAYNRNGIAYTSIHKERRSTDIVWDEENFEDITEILDDRANEHKLIATGKAKYWKDLYITFARFKNIESVKNAAQAIITRDFLLTDKATAWKMIQDFMIDNSRSPNTRNQYLSLLSSVFKFGIREGLCPFDPTNTMDKLKENKRAVPGEKDVEVLVADLKSYPIKTQYYIRLILLSGLRIQEAMNIRYEDYDQEFLTIHGKGDRERYFPLYPFPEIYELLNEINDKFGKHGWIFGSRYDAGRYNTMRRTALTRKTFINFHLLRKFRENELVFKLKVDKDIVAKMFGHTINIQNKHYMKEGFAKDEMKKYFGEPKIIVEDVVVVSKI